MPSYQYEQLNGESFQQLCQSLLTKEFPNIQCFPVGQPDGGRDAISRLQESLRGKTNFVLFQVKFARRDLGPSEARDWLLRTLRDELPKVQMQIGNGAERFVLVTNVSGTAHSNTGSIDKLQDLLQELIPIPTQAWWRGDIDRRLDDSWDLKLAHPGLLTGVDYLRLALEAGPEEGSERRQRAIRAFLATQFESDREVKFKQAELVNDLFELFTDVPMVPHLPAGGSQRTVERLESAFRRAANSTSNEIDPVRIHQWVEIASRSEASFEGYYSRGETWMGAATLLLDSGFQQLEPLVILEGAPGQGKSTITQYICQVHRLRLLSRHRGEVVDPNHLASPLRLPFKVELRDFATWISGGNPFGAAGDNDSLFGSQRSLEGFLSALVRSHSGGSSFDVSDFQATLGSSSVLIVLDGLDEVAEINQRERVVEEITAAVTRINALAASLQIVVTSRPTPFTNSPIIPRHTFATYTLESLTRPLIAEYAERWLRSRAIDETDANDVRQILDAKLVEPHLRDLARNPMQLAILLSLIHRRGTSLPDKRTALYDNYVEMFFDRESEKATVVKENRDLLIRIHRYLAWILHAGAEVSSESTSDVGSPGNSSTGKISERDLKELLRRFLDREGSDPALVEKLFTGMVERVVAIVSRVQGLYEFDVQTLREYFAARHLYQTAPYSPAGDERGGTISDRWRAISRNFYWLNVARFYAGCYSEGELPSLVEELRSLKDDEIFRFTSHPQLLTATLLGDWVFSQRPRAIEDAIDLILEPRGLRMLTLGAGLGQRQIGDVIVKDSVSRRRLVAACKQLVRPDRPLKQDCEALGNVLRPNSIPQELYDWWIGELRSADEAQAKRWCELGEYLQCWSGVDVGTVTELIGSKVVPKANVIAALLHANRMDVLESDGELFGSAVEAVLDDEIVGRSRGGSLLQKFANAVDLESYTTHHPKYFVVMRSGRVEYSIERRTHEEGAAWPIYLVAKRCARLVAAFTNAVERPIGEWISSIEPWDQIVEQGITEFGGRKRFVEIANLAAGIRSSQDKCLDSPDLFDGSRPMVRRVRYARLRAGSRNWWSRQFQSAKDASEIRMALMIFTTWAGARTVEALAAEIDNLIRGLEAPEWKTLQSSVRNAVAANSSRPWIKPLAIRVAQLPPTLSPRTAAIIADRCTQSAAESLYQRFLADYEGDDPIIFAKRVEFEVRHAIGERASWPQAIEGLKSSYLLGVSPRLDYFRLRTLRSTLPDAVAKEVVDRPIQFPAALVQVAEARYRQLATTKIVPVGSVAADERWFADERSERH